MLIENGRAVGVEYSRKGNVTKVHADREVILSAGVVNSPANPHAFWHWRCRRTRRTQHRGRAGPARCGQEPSGPR
ncbi:GMC family oxidoreductase N-terminal domain-containing protein [Brucella pituitosa]|uniref:GMC family oxidoreductase N-terminal domain-containing protein n=1 Tax=Brucella pituitosa TaxID=571256 RepID=UPI002092ED30|nr:GMC family oxidoreductase N-terminal domain-containing protein [Brucella pituitosa]